MFVDMLFPWSAADMYQDGGEFLVGLSKRLDASHVSYPGSLDALHEAVISNIEAMAYLCDYLSLVIAA